MFSQGFLTKEGLFLNQNNPEPKVKVLVPMYEPLEVSKFKKCSRILVEPKELIDFWKTEEKYRD